MEIIPFSTSDQALEMYLLKISTKSRIIYGIIIGIILVGISILPFIYVDVTVLARGYFQSDIEKQLITIPSPGKITFTAIHNGDFVRKGDTLLVMDSESVTAQIASLMKKISENESSIADLNKLIKISISADNKEGLKFITQRYRAEFENLKSLYQIQLQKYQKRKSENERNEILFKQQIIPKTEYENSLYLLSSEKDNLDQILISQKLQWENDLSIRNSESASLLASLKQCREDLGKKVIIAPVDGEIIQSSDIQNGGNVISGQQIAEISPAGDLIATCFVKPSDIGFIHEKQRVKIQVDAFNYNEWGMLQGNIVDISDDMILENGSTAYFRVKCKPERTFLSLKNGVSADIKKGMSVNTRIMVIRRSLFHLLFDKADKWFNPYNYKKEQ